MPGLESSSTSTPSLRFRSATTRFSGSASTNQAATPFAAASAAATNPGVASETDESSPPKAGPSTKPMPNAAPMSPIPRARSSGFVTSAM
jgi:hypothetical protein